MNQAAMFAVLANHVDHETFVHDGGIGPVDSIELCCTTCDQVILTVDERNEVFIPTD